MQNSGPTFHPKIRYSSHISESDLRAQHYIEFMDSHESQPQISRTRLKPFLFYLSSTLVLFLALSLAFNKAHFLNFQYLKSIIWSNPIIFQSHISNTKKSNPISLPVQCLLWMAPFLSGGGYCSESWSYILAINELNMKVPRFLLTIEQHGDLESNEFWDGMPDNVKSLAFQLYQNQRQCKMNETIVICHSEPGAWYPPLFQTYPCPPTGYEDFMLVIGRTMFETDRVNREHVDRCNRMDYVWVPTEFHVNSFVQSGVDPSKVVKIVQPIDVKFFDPIKYNPLDFDSIGMLVLGSRTGNLDLKKNFVFLSVFKWEYRKGWDILLKAYLKEFSQADGVSLYLLTNPYHSDRDFGNKIVEFVENADIERPINGWAPIYVIDTHIPQMDLPKMYKAADVFILPSRGEGWGRPLVEAMAMSLPVIATNWSGPTEYLTEENGYPLTVDKMSEVKEGPFKGHLWAEPPVGKLQILMRHVSTNFEEAKAKGRKAREDMITRFSPEIIAAVVTEHIQNILEKTTKKF